MRFTRRYSPHSAGIGCVRDRPPHIGAEKPTSACGFPTERRERANLQQPEGCAACRNHAFPSCSRLSVWACYRQNAPIAVTVEKDKRYLSDIRQRHAPRTDAATSRPDCGYGKRSPPSAGRRAIDREPAACTAQSRAEPRRAAVRARSWSQRRPRRRWSIGDKRSRCR
jgi:hypothetical protein